MTLRLEIGIDEFTKKEYHFYVDDTTLYLDNYALLRKESKRHKYVAKEVYRRLSTRESTITESEVPFTGEIKAMALKKFISLLSVKKWSERGK